MSTSKTQYHPLMMTLHWLTLALLIGVYALVEFRGWVPKGDPLRDTMQSWHDILGLTVFCLVFVRLALRKITGTPAIQPPIPAWQDRLAHAMHIALYIFLIAMPLLGWLTLSARGRPIPFYGWEWPALIGADKPLAYTLQDIHEVIGNIGYFLIGLHAAAAILHHTVMHDNTLTRMLPGRNRATP